MRSGVILVALSGWLVLAGCAQPSRQEIKLVHVVLFKVKPGCPPEMRQEMREDAERLLADLPMVRGLWLGTPADTKTPDRPMVKDDYDLGLAVLFDDVDGLNDYLEHPDHVTFARRHDPRCDLRVFDIVTPGP